LAIENMVLKLIMSPAALTAMKGTCEKNPIKNPINAYLII